MNINITRKCKQCKEFIDLEKDNFIYIKDRYYHFNCAVEEQLKRKNNKQTKEDCISKYQIIQNENEEKINHIISKEKLYKWLQFTYNTVVLPSYFYIKMDEIFSGVYKGLNKEIPPEDLFDMWKRKLNELERVNNQNNRKGKNLIGVARIQYDLAILLGKYDSYLKWKEEQKIIELERQQIENDFKNKIEFNKINSANKENQDRFEISDILDEI